MVLKITKSAVLVLNVGYFSYYYTSKRMKIYLKKAMKVQKPYITYNH